MILSAPLHPSLIDFGSKYFYLGQKVDLQFHNLLKEYKTVVSLLYWLSYKSICEILRGNMQIVWGGVAGVQGYIGGVRGGEG